MVTNQTVKQVVTYSVLVVGLASAALTVNSAYSKDGAAAGISSINFGQKASKR